MWLLYFGTFLKRMNVKQWIAITAMVLERVQLLPLLTIKITPMVSLVVAVSRIKVQQT